MLVMIKAIMNERQQRCVRLWTFGKVHGCMASVLLQDSRTLLLLYTLCLNGLLERFTGAWQACLCKIHVQYCCFIHCVSMDYWKGSRVHGKRAFARFTYIIVALYTVSQWTFRKVHGCMASVFLQDSRTLLLLYTMCLNKTFTPLFFVVTFPTVNQFKQYLA